MMTRCTHFRMIATLTVLAIMTCSEMFVVGVSGIDCITYSQDLCQKQGNCTPTRERCTEGEDACFSSWTFENTNNSNNTRGELVMKLQGCWLWTEACDPHGKCINQPANSHTLLYLCCCKADVCNRRENITFIEYPKPNTTTGYEGPMIYHYTQQNLQPVIYIFIGLVAVCIFVTVGYWMYRKSRDSYLQAIPISDPTPLAPSTPLLGLRPIQLIEVKARGRFGAVWKAQCAGDVVAVKIFPLSDKQSWMNERDIFNLPGMKHDNLLRFIASERRGENLNTDFWLISEFHDNGSLYDYLKGNLLSWCELLRLAESMARGLSYLHEDIPASRISEHKPAIAHRDFKSKNVLIKSDLTACLADFGLAMPFDPCKNPGDAHGQVGTRRYMAPEVLEGAISFNRDAFLRIDMYACGLVLWEMVNRCKAVDGPVPDYVQPFEEDVGLHPTLEDMQDHVVTKKGRPVIKETWIKHEGLKLICDTMEECWDHDSEARLSAGCVEERISQLSKTTTNTSNNSPISAATVLLEPDKHLSNIDTNV
ncbi:activin receptor type-2B-like [Tubulanus polymorphus]|uniref:activin receptor type-2B-like n=1 Tax=Tubulanus polymorphus TaxID=672921 RepID=UPI003DA667BD